MGERIDAILGSQVVGDAAVEQEGAKEGKVRACVRANMLLLWGGERVLWVLSAPS